MVECDVILKKRFIIYTKGSIIMELHIFLKGKMEPMIFRGDRIDVLDIEMKGIKYKQIRYFRKGFSKSQYIDSKLITRMKSVE